MEYRGLERLFDSAVALVAWAVELKSSWSSVASELRGLGAQRLRSSGASELGGLGALGPMELWGPVELPWGAFGVSLGT